MSEVTLTLTGMTCGHCVAHARQALEGIAGVREAAVTLDPQRAVVRFEAPAEVPAMLAALAGEGYPATPA